MTIFFKVIQLHTEFFPPIQGGSYPERTNIMKSTDSSSQPVGQKSFSSERSSHKLGGSKKPVREKSDDNPPVFPKEQPVDVVLLQKSGTFDYCHL